TARSISRA
ncbi:HAD hydrolase, IA, variant 1 family protein, partial [Vibrio parahaemolyticus AQ3810]